MAHKTTKWQFPPCFSHFPIRFFMFHLFFHQCLWVFPMFPLVFLPVFYYRLYDLKSTTCKKTDQFNMIEIAKKLVRDNQTWLPAIGRFWEKEMKTKNRLISALNSTQLLSQKLSLRKELNPDCEGSNKKRKVDKKNALHNTGNQKTYTDIPSSRTS